MIQPPRQTLTFPPFSIPAGVDLLYFGETVVPLEPQAVRVLRYLATHHERVVSKEELLERVWPDVFTTDGVLKKAISQARRALGDEAGRGRFIETYHGRGYRFVAPVTLTSADDRQHHEAASSTPVAPSSDDRVVAAEAGAASDPNYDQLVGREAELTALCAEYRRALEGAGRPVLILGEPGIGKTLLARRFQTWARAQGALCAYARFFDYRGSQLGSYEIFLDILRIALGLVTTDARGRRNSGLIYDLRQIAQARCGVTLPEELFAAAGRETGSLARAAASGAGGNFRLIVPISKCLVRLSRQRPLVLVFDDLQWADEASRDLIAYLMRTTEHEPLMLVALARQGGAEEPDGALAEWLQRQASYRSYTSLALKPLDEQACRLAIELAFGGESRSPDLPPQDLLTLFRVTGGNPYFLTEMLRLLVAEGAIRCGRREPWRWQWQGIKDLHLPDTIVLAAQAKLERLFALIRDLLEQASVIGDEFRVETLARMTGRNEDEIESWLREGLSRGVLSDQGLSAGEDYRFYHTILRRVLYDRLPARRRKQLHARAALALELVYGFETDRVAQALSAHYEAAGDLGRTYEWGLRAWQAARGHGHWSEAVSSIERAQRAALELGHLAQRELAPANRLTLLLGLGEGYYSVGRLKASESILAEAVGLARSLNEPAALATALLQQGQTRIGLGQHQEAIVATAEALAAYRQLGRREDVALALVQLSTAQVALGNYEAVAQLTEEVFAGVSTESQLAATAIGLLGWARALQGRLAEGKPLLERALDYYDRTGDLRCRAHSRRRLHWVRLSQGQYEQAISLAVGARDDFRSVGDVGGEAKLNMSIGQARIAQGLYDEGHAFLNRALESLRAIGDTHCEAETLWLIGRARIEAGQFDQAAEPLARALELVRAVGDRDDEFRVLADTARLQISRGDAQGGLCAANQAVALAEELHNRDGLGAALIERARAYLDLSQPFAALEAAERAVKLLDSTESGERWRGYWVLGLVSWMLGESQGTPYQEDALQALRSAVALCDEIREQLDAADVARRAAITRAHAGPARDFYALLLQLGLTSEAQVVASRWLADGAEVGTTQ